MQLFSPRVRLLLMFVVWLIAIGALALWLSASQVKRISIGGGPSGSESLALTTAIADVINNDDIGLHVRVFETGGSYENLRLLEKNSIDMAEVQVGPEQLAKVKTSPENLTELAFIWKGVSEIFR